MHTKLVSHNCVEQYINCKDVVEGQKKELRKKENKQIGSAILYTRKGNTRMEELVSILGGRRKDAKQIFFYNNCANERYGKIKSLYKKKKEMKKNIYFLEEVLEKPSFNKTVEKKKNIFCLHRIPYSGYINEIIKSLIMRKKIYCSVSFNIIFSENGETFLLRCLTFLLKYNKKNLSKWETFSLFLKNECSYSKGRSFITRGVQHFLPHFNLKEGKYYEVEVVEEENIFLSLSRDNVLKIRAYFFSGDVNFVENTPFANSSFELNYRGNTLFYDNIEIRNLKNYPIVHSLKDTFFEITVNCSEMRCNQCKKRKSEMGDSRYIRDIRDVVAPLALLKNPFFSIIHKKENSKMGVNILELKPFLITPR
ncbi:hypothetical protein POVWA2_021000 [Plasmodium ovale wallikeri]|uniref:Uncharacterized protein n=1 Tax=Plasmodium ovale wallikeri TaxID=864142 RepID=A0A1A8YT06_PLAOA|nr:hypothetical protein POVWA1_020790 [Plasmodium ovale wallikeri]SBT34649.1 hypothetical protein POVWA2_021000 [Plasmodium ovale wallikeri]